MTLGFRNEIFSPKFRLAHFGGQQQENCSTLVDSAPKLYSLIQKNIGPNFGDGLNFITCEYFFPAAHL